MPPLSRYRNRQYILENSALRMEDVVYEKLELKKEGNRANNLEHLGQAMVDAGNEFGPSTPYGSNARP